MSSAKFQRDPPSASAAISELAGEASPLPCTGGADSSGPTQPSPLRGRCVARGGTQAASSTRPLACPGGGQIGPARTRPTAAGSCLSPLMLFSDAGSTLGELTVRLMKILFVVASIKSSGRNSIIISGHVTDNKIWRHNID